MNPNETAALTSTIAIIISSSIPNDEEFALFALAINQLSDTLNTMVLQRAIINRDVAIIKEPLGFNGNF